MKKLLMLMSVLVVSLFLSMGSASATLIGLTTGLPDIISDSTGTYSYNRSTFLFSSSADALNITFDGVNEIPITGGTYSVSFNVDNGGNFIAPVTDLLINGTFTYNTITYSGLLLDGVVTNFGWSNALGAPYFAFDFTFNTVGGALQSFFPVGGYDIALAEHSNFTSWTVDHGSTTAVKHDTSAVPEPATMLLLGSGLIGLAGFARRKFKK